MQNCRCIPTGALAITPSVNYRPYKEKRAPVAMSGIIHSGDTGRGDGLCRSLSEGKPVTQRTPALVTGNERQYAHKPRAPHGYANPPPLAIEGTPLPDPPQAVLSHPCASLGRKAGPERCNEWESPGPVIAGIMCRLAPLRYL
jgi:hypothetical protein